MNDRTCQVNPWPKTLSILLVMAFLAGCAAQPAAVPSTATPPPPTDTPEPTATPLPTDTPEPTDTPLPPTRTPVPTATRLPTATPFPKRDPKTMLNWKELGLPAGFEAYDPESIGIQEGATAFYLVDGKVYEISGSFLFANGTHSNINVYGYTIELPADDDRLVFDQVINQLDVFFEAADLTVIPGGRDIGTHSKAAAGTSNGDNFATVAFRLDDIGAFAFVRSRSGVDPGLDVIQVARVYAQSLDESTSYCKITSIRAVPDTELPMLVVEAEGFYPQEGRYIQLEGTIVADGKAVDISAFMTGGTGQTTDADGHLEAKIEDVFFMIHEGDANTSLPEAPYELTVTVGGYQSGCEASQDILWP